MLPKSRSNPDIAARVLKETSDRVSRQPIAGCIDSLGRAARNVFKPTRLGEMKEPFVREYPPLPPAIEETSLRSPYNIQSTRQAWPNRSERLSFNPDDKSFIVGREDRACGVFMDGIDEGSTGIADESP